MSPELFNNQPYSYKSDVWSLGCCVYEMASLKHAFSATSIHALMAQVVQGKVGGNFDHMIFVNSFCCHSYHLCLVAIALTYVT